MLREEHNHYFNVDRQPDEYVQCSYFDGTEISQYDRNCAPCWHGHQHTWEQHNAYINSHRRQEDVVLVDESRYFTLTGQPWQIYADPETAKYPVSVMWAASEAHTLGNGWHISQDSATFVLYRLDVNVVDRHITIRKIQ